MNLHVSTALSFLLFAGMGKMLYALEHERSLRGGNDFGRQTTSAVGRIKELLWINADTDQRISVGTPTVFIEPIIEYADVTDGYELPNGEMSIEAVVEGGPVGSVRFTFNDQVYIENTAPYALCANKGTDFFPCAGLRANGGKVTAQVFAGKDATGASSELLLTYIRYNYKTVPGGYFIVYNADTDKEMFVVTGSQFVPTINVTQTPNIAVFIDAPGARYRWSAESARIDYDNGARVEIENNRPLVFPGNSGSDFFGFTPKLGNSNLEATLYSKKYLQGQNTTWSMKLVGVV